MQRIVERARSGGRAVGTFIDDVEGARRWAGFGMQFISYAVDMGIIQDAIKGIVTSLRGTSGGRA